MIRFCYSLAFNPMEVACFLEGSGLAHEPIPVDPRDGNVQARLPRTGMDDARRHLFRHRAAAG